jgi:hypothetical protein
VVCGAWERAREVAECMQAAVQCRCRAAGTGATGARRQRTHLQAVWLVVTALALEVGGVGRSLLAAGRQRVLYDLRKCASHRAGRGQRNDCGWRWTLSDCQAALHCAVHTTLCPTQHTHTPTLPKRSTLSL